MTEASASVCLILATALAPYQFYHLEKTECLNLLQRFSVRLLFFLKTEVS